MSFHLWTAFFVANLLVSLSPGPGALAAMNAGLTHGWRGGLAVVVGLELALLLQLLLVALGAGVLLQASDSLFLVLRWGGAAYLTGLGLVEMHRACRPSRPTRAAAAVWPRQGLVWRGMLVNLSNPKSILFMTAFVPQFIDPLRSLASQYGLIALTMCSVDALVMAAYAQLAARLRPCFADTGLARVRHAVFGLAFVAFGLALLFFRPANGA
jgi:homoserine/homoserine lactone efflux protein